MKDYQGPKNFFEFSMWYEKRLPFGNERVGQAFYNDFSLQYKNSYECEDAYDAFTLLTDGLTQMFPDFWKESK